MIQIQPRDTEIISNLAEHRFLRSSHIRELVKFPSERSCQKRLKALCGENYIQVVRRRFGDFRVGGGSNPSIFALGSKGAELLAKRYSLWMSSRWRDNNRDAGDRFLDHDLELADFMVRLELQCRKRGDVDLIPFQEILRGAPETTRQWRRPRQFPVVVEWEHTSYRRYVSPDKLFGLRNRNLPEGGNRRFFFLEIDRGTETIDPRSRTPRKTSIREKMLEYAHAYRDELVQKFYNLPGFRTLFVTTSAKRVENFIGVHRKYTRRRPLQTPSALFLFADREALKDCGDDLLGLSWQDGKGKTAMLLA